MRRLLPILLLMLIPLTHAYILVYSNGFDYRQNYGRDVYINVQSVDQIVRTWQDWGFSDVQAGSRIDPNADGIVVLGCTKIDDEDLQALEEYIKNGGRVAIDLFCPGKMDDFMYQYGVIRSEKPYQGTILQKLSLPYAEVRGFPVDRPIIMRDTPVNSKYVKMIYVGPSFTKVGDTFSDVFITPTGQSVAFIGAIGNGKVYASGCLLCSNQLLMANILDWLKDGKIDFPSFEVDRRVYPSVKKVGEPFYDEIRISVPPEEKQSLDIAVAYPYNEEGFCKLVPVQERDVQGNTIVFRFEYKADEAMSCNLAPVIVSMTWISPEGKIIREFSIPSEYIQVIAPKFSIPPNLLPYIALAGIAILGIVGWVLWKKREERKLKEMKLHVRALEQGLKDLQKKFMTRQITEDVYKRLTERYLAEIEELKAKIQIMEEQKNRKKSSGGAS